MLTPSYGLVFHCVHHLVRGLTVEFARENGGKANSRWLARAGGTHAFLTGVYWSPAGEASPRARGAMCYPGSVAKGGGIPGDWNCGLGLKGNWAGLLEG